MGMPAWSFKDYFHLTREIVAESVLGSGHLFTFLGGTLFLVWFTLRSFCLA